MCISQFNSQGGQNTIIYNFNKSKFYQGKPNKDELLADLGRLLSKHSSLIITPKLQLTATDDSYTNHLKIIKNDAVERNKHRDSKISVNLINTFLKTGKMMKDLHVLRFGSKVSKYWLGVIDFCITGLFMFVGIPLPGRF